MFGPYANQCFNGTKFDFTETDVRKQTGITIRHIATALSLTYRFRGATKTPISVASHSIGVCRVTTNLWHEPEYKTGDRLIRIQLVALLHDAHEAFMGDIPAPFKRFMRDKGGCSIYELEQTIDRQIYERFQITPPTEEEIALIRLADSITLKLERDCYMPGAEALLIDNLTIPSCVAWYPYGDKPPAEAALMLENRLSNAIAEELIYNANAD